MGRGIESLIISSKYMLNFYWIYDMPNWALCTLIIFTLSAFSTIGIRSTRKLARRMMARPHGQNEAVGIYISAIGVFYGITLGLITVGASTTFNDLSAQVDREATSIASFYRKVSNYPAPIGSILQEETRVYTNYIIEIAWPLQRKGIIPGGIVKQVLSIEQKLDSFEPVTESQKALHPITLTAFDEMSKLGRLRLQNVQNGLPAPLWSVVIIGALLNIFLTWLLVLDSEKPHIWLGIVFTGTIGILIFLTAAMDNPFRGEFSVSAGSYQMVYDQLMKIPK
jgi:Protein of unknown function (DUF4239)